MPSDYRVRRTLVGSLFALALALPAAAGPKPVIEYSSFMKGVKVYLTNPNDQSKGAPLAFMDVWSAFVPEQYNYTGQADYAYPIKAVITRTGSDDVLFEKRFFVNEDVTVFDRLQPYGPENLEMSEPGDYVVTFQLEGEPMTRLPFTISHKQSDDAFNPQKYTIVDGPWNDWAYIALSSRDGANPSFNCWLRGGLFTKKGERESYTMQAMYKGDALFTANEQVRDGRATDSEWRVAEFTMKYDESKGSGMIKNADLLKMDGDYHIVIRRDGEVYGVYPFTIKDGKIVPNPRQDMNYEPHVDYLAGRRALDAHYYEDLFWLKRLSDDEAKAVASTGAKKVEGPSASDRDAWVVKPQIDAGRPLAVVLTQAQTRFDAGLDAGDGVIAFATGSMKGVSFLRVGEDTEQSIPNGTDYSAKAFQVCGKKIVLVKGQQVCVFDTTTGQTTEIPENEITLASGPHPEWKLVADGYLVATINDPKKLDDRTLMKVIDVSGDTPRIIPIKNPDIRPNDITSVGVDAVAGKFVMASKSKKAVYVADVAPNATLSSLDLSGADGVGDCQVLVSGGFAFYADASGSANFRSVGLADGKITSFGPWGKAKYDVCNGCYVFPNDEPASAADQYLIGQAPEAAKRPANSGQDIPDSNGKFGQGSSSAITSKGVVFIAGDKGLGSGEFLQASDGGDWVAIKGADGKPIPATDVVMGDSMMVFRTGERNNTVVAYVTFGENVSLGGN